jgi:hypothetical protein
MTTTADHLAWFTQVLPNHFWTAQLKIAHWRSEGEIVGTMAILLGSKNVQYFYGSLRADVNYEGTIIFEREAAETDMPEVLKLILANIQKINTVTSPTHVTIARH